MNKLKDILWNPKLTHSERVEKIDNLRMNKMQHLSDEFKCSIEKIQEFVHYVWDFYAPDSDLYPIEGLIKRDIVSALFVYLKRIEENDNYSWGDGDSLDRERVRDIILENPKFTWSS